MKVTFEKYQFVGLQAWVDEIFNVRSFKWLESDIFI